MYRLLNKINIQQQFSSVTVGRFEDEKYVKHLINERFRNKGKQKQSTGGKHLT